MSVEISHLIQVLSQLSLKNFQMSTCHDIALLQGSSLVENEGLTSTQNFAIGLILVVTTCGREKIQLL